MRRRGPPVLGSLPQGLQAWARWWEGKGTHQLMLLLQLGLRLNTRQQGEQEEKG